MSDDPEREEQRSEAEGSSAQEPEDSPTHGSETGGSSPQEPEDSPTHGSEAASGEAVSAEVMAEQTSSVEGPPATGEVDEESKRIDIGLPEKEAPESSGFGHFLKRGLRWAVFLLVVFTIGVVLMQIVRVGPLRDEVDALNQSLSDSEAAQQALQTEVSRLEGVEASNQNLGEQIQNLNDTLERARARQELLNVLVDVTRAQLALAQEDPLRVADALESTGDRLSALSDLVDASELESMRERLMLVLSEVDSDPFAAQRDLEILANTLLEIEQELSAN